MNTFNLSRTSLDSTTFSVKSLDVKNSFTESSSSQNTSTTMNPRKSGQESTSSRARHNSFDFEETRYLNQQDVSISDSGFNYVEPRTSYSIDNLLRLLTLNRDLINQIKELHPNPPTLVRKKLAQISELKDSSVEHQTYLERLMAQVETLTIQRDNLKDSTTQRRSKLSSRHELLSNSRVELSNEWQKIRQTHILWLDARRVLGLNRARLAQGLNSIFPITQYPEDMDILCIRGNPLPTLVIGM